MKTHRHAGKKEQCRHSNGKSLACCRQAAGYFKLFAITRPAAMLKAKEVKEDYDRKLEAWGKKMAGFLSGRAVQLKKNYDGTMELLHKEDNEQTGEGLANADFLSEYKAASDQFLSGYNGDLESLYKEYLSIEKPSSMILLTGRCNVQWPEMFEAIKLQTKMAWLEP